MDRTIGNVTIATITVKLALGLRYQGIRVWREIPSVEQHVSEDYLIDITAHYLHRLASIRGVCRRLNDIFRSVDQRWHRGAVNSSCRMFKLTT